MTNVITNAGPLAALKAARQFIVNGTALGFIRMPDADTPDSAHDTLPMIERAIADLEAAPALPDCRPAPACSTCQDHGVIGWTSGQTAESFDQGERECPDCSEAAKPVAVVKHVAMGCIDWLIWPRDLPLGTKLYASPPAPVLPEPEQLFEAIAGALGEAMDCTRVWAAWGVGTMSEDDFSLVADDQERLHEIASACLAKIKESNQ